MYPEITSEQMEAGAHLRMSEPKYEATEPAPAEGSAARAELEGLSGMHTSAIHAMHSPRD